MAKGRSESESESESELELESVVKGVSLIFFAAVESNQDQILNMKTSKEKTLTINKCLVQGISHIFCRS